MLTTTLNAEVVPGGCSRVAVNTSIFLNFYVVIRITDGVSVTILVESPGVYGLEAGPLGPEFPVGNDGRGNGDAQLLFVSKDTSGVVGSEDGRGDPSEPTNEVVVVLTGLLTTEEPA